MLFNDRGGHPDSRDGLAFFAMMGQGPCLPAESKPLPLKPSPLPPTDRNKHFPGPGCRELHMRSYFPLFYNYYQSYVYLYRWQNSTRSNPRLFTR